MGEARKGNSGIIYPWGAPKEQGPQGCPRAARPFCHESGKIKRRCLRRRRIRWHRLVVYIPGVLRRSTPGIYTKPRRNFCAPTGFLFMILCQEPDQGGNQTPMRYMENGHARSCFRGSMERLCTAPSHSKHRKHKRPLFLKGAPEYFSTPEYEYEKRFFVTSL